VKIFLGRLAFDQLGPQRAAQLNAIETAFKLSPGQVELAIAAGRDALKTSSVFNAFLTSIRNDRARAAHVASPIADPQEAMAQ
jgi:hypothetical protein